MFLCWKFNTNKCYLQSCQTKIHSTI